MSAATLTYQGPEIDYQVDYRRVELIKPRRSRRVGTSRKRATGFNGLHRRRNKRWTW